MTRLGFVLDQRTCIAVCPDDDLAALVDWDPAAVWG